MMKYKMFLLHSYNVIICNFCQTYIIYLKTQAARDIDIERYVK